MTITELIASCKKNDRVSQGLLFERFKDELYLTSLKYCRNEAEAEDNLHDSFVTIFQTIKKYKGTGSFEGWMKRITINKAIDKYKHNKSTPYNLNDNLADEDPINWRESGVSLDDILRSIQELPDQYRLVFNLYQLDAYSHKEIAGMLDISEGTSRSNFHRAKALLKEKILQTMQNQNQMASP